MNVDVSCPNCSTLFTVRRDLLGKRTKCTKCGQGFVIAEPAAKVAPVTPAPALSSPEIIPQIRTIPAPEPPPALQFTVEPTPAVSSPRSRAAESVAVEPKSTQPRFPALRMVARAYEIMAILTFAIGVVLVVVLLITTIRQPGEFLSDLLAIGLPAFWTMVSAIVFHFFAQAIRLGLQVEENTRETQQACRQLADHLCSIDNEQ